MSEEEKKVIEELENMIEQSKDLREEEFYKLATIHNLQNVVDILKTVKRLKKELEQEKAINKSLLQCLKDSNEKSKNEHLFLGNSNM